jgi:hypothetical protein
MDLSGAITNLASDSISVSRPAAATYDSKGRLVNNGTASTFSARASVQPATGKDLLRMPEGLRTTDLQAIFCATELKTGDLVTLPEGVYQVQHVEVWARSGNFYRAVASRRPS